MHNINISVIIPVYNSAISITECLHSILGQTVPPTEIIVVDDGSTDNSKEKIENFIQTSPIEIKYIYQNNAGSGTARNLGISLAKCDWVAFIDADDVWLPEKLEKQTALIRKYPKARFISSNYYLNNTTDLGITPTNPEILNSDNTYYGDYITNAKLGCSITTITTLARKDFLESAGLFGTQRRGQDTDLWCRIGIIGEPILYDNTPLAKCETPSPPYNFGSKLYLEERIQQINSLYAYSVQCGKQEKFIVLATLLVEDTERQLLYQKRNREIIILMNQLSIPLPWKYKTEKKLRAISPNILGALLNTYHKSKKIFKQK